MSLKVKTHQRCPYDMPPPPKPDQVPKTLNRRDLWDALEFFRIEALLRSQSVWALYRRASQRASPRRGDVCPEPKNMQQWVAWYGQNKVQRRGKGKAYADISALLWDETLRDRFAVAGGWAILLGSHHRYLKLDLGPDVSVIPDANNLKRSSFRLSEGIVDLCALARVYNYSVPLKELQKEQKRFQYLKIDTAIAPTANIKNLRDLLKKRHNAETVTVEKPSIDPITGEQTFPFHPRKDPPITDVRAWLKYFQCYNLRVLDNQTYGQIAESIYGSKKLRDNAEKALARVEEVIHAAEENAWPPICLSR